MNSPDGLNYYEMARKQLRREQMIGDALAGAALLVLVGVIVSALWLTR